AAATARGERALGRAGAEERNGARWGGAVTRGQTSDARANEKDAAVGNDAGSDCAAERAADGDERTATGGGADSRAALLGCARRFRRDLDRPDLELFFLSPMDTSGAITVDEGSFDREVMRSDKPVIVDFWAEWCGPCKLIAPLLDEIAREKIASVKVTKVNVDENQSLSLKYNIRAIPALLFFKNGQLRDQVTGVTSKKDLLNRVDALA